MPEWSPLGSPAAGVNPVIWQGTLAQDSGLSKLLPDTYCFRVRARSDRVAGLSEEVWGDYTYLQNGSTDSASPVGTRVHLDGLPRSHRPDGSSAGCNSGYLCSPDYLGHRSPVRRTWRTPHFTWKAVAGANSYYVVVAKDQNSATSSTRGSRESRRTRRATPSSRRPTETRRPPSTGRFSRRVTQTEPTRSRSTYASAGNFQKQSTPPSLLSPNSVQVFFDQPTFRWTPTLGARRYRIQVSADPSFGNPLIDVVTDATSYSSNTTYPADTVLYWRVRADDENLKGLTWSATGTFQKKLAAPPPSGANPTAGEMLPVWPQADPGRLLVRHLGRLARRDAQGLRQLPDAGDLVPQDDRHGRLPLAGPRKLPEADQRRGPGPYSATQSFTRTIGEPVNAKTDSARDHVLLSWDPRLGAKEYKVQIASTADFSRTSSRSPPTTRATRP